MQHLSHPQALQTPPTHTRSTPRDTTGTAGHVRYALERVLGRAEAVLQVAAQQLHDDHLRLLGNDHSEESRHVLVGQVPDRGQPRPVGSGIAFTAWLPPKQHDTTHTHTHTPHHKQSNQTKEENEFELNA